MQLLYLLPVQQKMTNFVCNRKVIAEGIRVGRQPNYKRVVRVHNNRIGLVGIEKIDKFDSSVIPLNQINQFKPTG
jgi:hypothetical protein